MLLCLFQFQRQHILLVSKEDHHSLDLNTEKIIIDNYLTLINKEANSIQCKTFQKLENYQAKSLKVNIINQLEILIDNILLINKLPRLIQFNQVSQINFPLKCIRREMLGSSKNTTNQLELHRFHKDSSNLWPLLVMNKDLWEKHLLIQVQRPSNSGRLNKSIMLEDQIFKLNKITIDGELMKNIMRDY